MNSWTVTDSLSARVHSVHKSAKISGVSLTNYNTIHSECCVMLAYLRRRVYMECTLDCQETRDI